MVESPTSQVFTIGKVDAGIAVLISDSVHLIEFPSLLLPLGVGPGSIVNISCTRNLSAEASTTSAFWSLQQSIFAEFGSAEPQPPKLKVRNVTQTSVTLEWEKLELARAGLLGLSIWRNGVRLTTIPNPLHNTSTKLSGLSLSTDYTFHLVLKTTAGTFSSPIVKIKTHSIADTSGVAVCFGLIEPEGLKEEAKEALGKMGGRFAEKIQIDTTHFVATSSASVGNPKGGAGVEYQKALQLSIPVVSPEWVLACAREQKMVPIANYYSVITPNLSASLSSANLAQKPLPQRRATVTISEDPPAPLVAPKSELAEEEPEAPPSDGVVGGKVSPEPNPSVDPSVGVSVSEGKKEEVKEEEVKEEEVKEEVVEEEVMEDPQKEPLEDEKKPASAILKADTEELEVEEEDELGKEEEEEVELGKIGRGDEEVREELEREGVSGLEGGESMEDVGL